jgi:NAD(P)-dependent dehydrogenase (short-subunit alcohol dehydrogenase family)
MTNAFTADDVSDQSGKTFLVTGANAGLGLETCKTLAARGARVLLGCRSEQRARAAMAEIRAETPDANLEFVPLDQADLEGVRRTADLVANEPRLDVLVNNAGIMHVPLERTQDGFEPQFGVNHLGTFALTSLLLGKLAEHDSGRVVITSSLAHRSGNIDFEDLDAKTSYKKTTRYNQSKLANLLFMYELDRRLKAASKPTITVACHPGIADTELLRHWPSALSFVSPLMRALFNDAHSGAWPTLMAATHPGAESGQYFGPSKRYETAGPARLVDSTRRSKDPELAKRLWERSIEMTGVDPGI